MLDYFKMTKKLEEKFIIKIKKYINKPTAKFAYKDCAKVLLTFIPS